ncbi:MAG TPA: pyrroline-5-carboxylate reductase [Rhizomicrobium sp.]
MTAPILLIGAGRMGTALLRGWTQQGLSVVAIEPHPESNLKRLKSVLIVRSVEDARKTYRACVIALKPQIFRVGAARLQPLARLGTPMISIAAGITTKFMRQAWGPQARIVRAMPNTPGAIGRGISALYAAGTAHAADKALAQSLLAALGETLWVKRESDMDIVTALSGSGPAYVFLLVEALAAAGKAEGLPADVAMKLARATVTGAGALLASVPTDAAELRRHVTSPHGTTEAALKVLMGKGGFAPLLAHAVAAARKRAAELGA